MRVLTTPLGPPTRWKKNSKKVPLPPPVEKNGKKHIPTEKFVVLVILSEYCPKGLLLMLLMAITLQY